MAEPIPEIEQRLAAARERREQAMRRARKNWRGEAREAYWDAHEAVLCVERELAAAKGEEYAVALDFPVEWDVGAPLPHLLCDDYRALLAFVIREPRPDWDGTSIELVSASDEKARPLALVEFRPCTAARLGAPNDEVHEGHPLAGKGMEGYTAQQVVNSRWLAELEAINRVHHCYNSAGWRERKHYVFWFHDTTFECIARTFTVEVHRESMAEMLTRMCHRLLS